MFNSDGMKILLISPYCLDQRVQDYDIKVVPQGLYYIGALLMEMGHEVKVLNWHDAAGQEVQITSFFEKEVPDIVGLSVMHASRWGGIDIARIVKKVDPETMVLFGGPGATFLWRHLLSNFKEIDAVVIGEGEATVKEIVESYQKVKSLDDMAWASINGLAYRKDDIPFQNPDRDFIENIDTLPDPARYFSFQHVSSSRGCPWNCSFCGSPLFWKRKVRFHSPQYFVDQLERLYQKGVNFFYVSDDTFTVKPERVVQICREIIDRELDITWFAISRVNCISEDILYWMRKAGCVQISFGVESGSAKIRKLFNKQISEKQIVEAFRMTASFGILPRAYFIYGAPGENKKTIKESLKLIERIKPLSAIFYILDLFPGTAMYDSFKKKSGNNDDIWLRRVEDIMYFETDSNLNSNDILAFGKILRDNFHSKVSDYALSADLKEIEEFYPAHADFLARLGMTFLMGDYSRIPEVTRKQETAKTLFEKALSYADDEKAYLGLGIIGQQRGDYQNSAELLSRGRVCFPESEQIGVCLGISLANSGKIEDALDIFLKYPASQPALEQALKCSRAIGNKELEIELIRRIESVSLHV